MCMIEEPRASLSSCRVIQKMGMRGIPCLVKNAFLLCSTTSLPVPVHKRKEPCINKKCCGVTVTARKRPLALHCYRYRYRICVVVNYRIELVNCLAPFKTVVPNCTTHSPINASVCIYQIMGYDLHLSIFQSTIILTMGTVYIASSS